LQENYIRLDPLLAHETSRGHPTGLAIETLVCLSNAAEAVAQADIIDNILHKLVILVFIFSFLIFLAHVLRNTDFGVEPITGH
jgi:hypothetical protein